MSPPPARFFVVTAAGSPSLSPHRLPVSLHLAASPLLHLAASATSVGRSLPSFSSQLPALRRRGVPTSIPARSTANWSSPGRMTPRSDAPELGAVPSPPLPSSTSTSPTCAASASTAARPSPSSSPSSSPMSPGSTTAPERSPSSPTSTAAPSTTPCPWSPRSPTSTSTSSSTPGASFSKSMSVSAAAFSSQTKFGSSCYFPIRMQAQPQPRQALLLPPLARKIPNSLVALKKSNSSSRCHAVAAEVEGLNIADDVTQHFESAIDRNIGGLKKNKWKQAGANHRYELLWVILIGLIFALIIQSLAANHGVVTGNKAVNANTSRRQPQI